MSGIAMLDDSSRLQFVRDQRLSALERARTLSGQLATKVRLLQEATAKNEREAAGRLDTLAAGRASAQARSRALATGLAETKEEVASLQWRVGALQRLLDVQPRSSALPCGAAFAGGHGGQDWHQDATDATGSPSVELLRSTLAALRQRRSEKQRDLRRSQDECQGLERRLQALQAAPDPHALNNESISLTKEALRAFAHGAVATWNRELQDLEKECSRRTAAIEKSIRKVQDMASAGSIGATPCWQSSQGRERLPMAETLLTTFEAAAKDCRTQASHELATLHRAIVLWKAATGAVVLSPREEAHEACAIREKRKNRISLVALA